jgi:molecular chaperone HtpG
MADRIERIPFQVDVSRIIEVLAKQIYQSPLALLRENTQNAFDAILLHRHRSPNLEPRIDITITEHQITIADNGVGMTPDELRMNYWYAGSSSKNTPEAREAGVVGTFGIGAMANFGIADELIIETEAAVSGERTRSSARKNGLSTTEECISLERLPSVGSAGTTVVALMEERSIDVAEASAYVGEFVAYVTLPVFINGELASQRDITDAVPPFGGKDQTFSAAELAPDLHADVRLQIARTGEVWLSIGNLRLATRPAPGRAILRQGTGSIRTYRSGFGLATVTLRSFYQFGGVADMRALQPTAGREALTTDSMQFLQNLVTAVDSFVSHQLAERTEADSNTNFMEWARRHGRFDLCGNLRIRVEPGNQRRLLSQLCAESTAKPVLTYEGSDASIIDSVASDDTPLAVLASQSPRRQCETEYLRMNCRVEQVGDAPTLLEEKPASAWTLEEQAVVFRIVSILATDYFLDANVLLGKLSHGLAILADLESKPVRIVLDPDGATFGVVRELYKTDYNGFSSMTKDFVRNTVFPRVADRVPSATREGAEAFLKTIRRTRDVFEYEWSDLDTLSSIWAEYVEGRLSMEEAADRSSSIVTRNVQVVDSSTARAVRDVVPDVIANEEATSEGDLDFGPAPPILRTETSSDAKLLTIDSDETALRGYRCFIALSDRVRDERGDFFLQPHSTSIVWGGQKLLFVFEHHSGQFGLYYDLQTPQVVAAESGGGPFATATIVLDGGIFIPIPESVMPAFVPTLGERKRLEVRCDLLFTEEWSSSGVRKHKG